MTELHSFIDQISTYQDELNKKYEQSIIPIYQSHSDIFSTEIGSHKFPYLISNNVADKIIDWFESHSLWNTLLGGQLEVIIDMVKTHRLEQSHMQTEMANLMDQNKLYLQNLHDTKDNEARLISENKGLQKSLQYVQEKNEEIQREVATLEQNKIFIEKERFEAKSGFDAALEQNEELNSKNQALQKELRDWVSTAESNATFVGSLENKIRQISSEKRDFELLLTRVYACIPSSEMQKIIGDMAKTQKELHIAQREFLANSQASQSAYEDLRASSQDPNSYDKTRFAQKNVDKYEEANELLRQHIESLKNKLAESNVDLKEVENKTRNIVPLNISINEPSKLPETSVLSYRRKSPIASEMHFSTENRLLPSTYRDRAKEAELNSFANTLSKVKQSLRKYGSTSIHNQYFFQ